MLFVPSSIPSIIPEVFAVQDKGDFKLVYYKTDNYTDYEKWITSTNYFETQVDWLNKTFKLPYDVTVGVGECGAWMDPQNAVNAYYMPSQKEIIYCYELMEHNYKVMDYLRLHGYEFAPTIFCEPFETNCTKFNPSVSSRALNVIDYIFYHEVGHAVIDVFNLPIPTAHEDNADGASAYILLEFTENGVGNDAIRDAAWDYLLTSSVEGLEFSDYAGQHSLSIQRFFNLACFAYGSNPSENRDLITAGLLPKDRAERCSNEYKQLVSSWDKLLEPYTHPETYTPTPAPTPTPTPAPTPTPSGSFTQHVDTNDKYSIQYPSNWIKEIDSDGYVTFSDKTNWDSYFFVIFYEDLDYVGSGSKHILDNMKRWERTSCTQAQYEEDGYICSSYHTKDSGTLWTDEGRQAFFIESEYTKKYHPNSTQEFLMRSIVIEVHDDNDAWYMYSEINDGYVGAYRDILIKSGLSIKPLQGGITPTPTPAPTPTPIFGNQYGTVSAETDTLEIPYSTGNQYKPIPIEIFGSVNLAAPLLAENSAKYTINHVYMTITKPDGSTEEQKAIVGMKEGVYENIIQICCNNVGKYTISANFRGNDIGTVTFNVVLKSNSQSTPTPAPTPAPTPTPTPEIEIISDSSFKTYTHDDKRFSIEYPDDWSVIGGEEAKEFGYESLVAFNDQYYWNTEVQVFWNENDPKGNRYDSQIFRDLEQAQFELCKYYTFAESGRECSDFKAEDSYVMYTNDNKKIYFVSMTYTIVFAGLDADDFLKNGQEYSVVSTVAIIFDGDSSWEITSESVDTYPEHSDEIRHMYKSFSTDSTSTPTPSNSNPQPISNQVTIPAWIKNNAEWWANGQIPDLGFLQGIQYLIEEGIMVIPPTETSGSSESQEVPAWIKNNAEWWAAGQIDDNTFVSGIQYLVKVGIIKVS